MSLTWSIIQLPPAIRPWREEALFGFMALGAGYSVSERRKGREWQVFSRGFTFQLGAPGVNMLHARGSRQDRANFPRHTGFGRRVPRENSRLGPCPAGHWEAATR